MPVHINRLLIFSGLAIASVLVIVGVAFWNWSLSSKFGRVEIPLQDGTTVYAVRESWGLSSEQLSLTRNPDGCTTADPAHDYIYRNPADSAVLYSVTANGLTIFDSPFNRVVEEPAHPWNNVKMSRSKDPFYDDVRADPKKYGAVLTKISLNETCWRNIFRRENSLR